MLCEEEEEQTKFSCSCKVVEKRAVNTFLTPFSLPGYNGVDLKIGEFVIPCEKLSQVGGFSPLFKEIDNTTSHLCRTE